MIRDGYGVAGPAAVDTEIGPVLHHVPVAGVVVGVSTIWVTVPVLVRNPVAPLYVAVICCVPSVRVLVVNVAWPPARTTAGGPGLACAPGVVTLGLSAASALCVVRRGRGVEQRSPVSVAIGGRAG